MRQLTVAREGPLLPCLLESLGPKRKDVKNLLRFGAVAVNGAVVRQFDHVLSPGDTITIGDLQTTAAQERLKYARIQVLYEDPALIVVDKPAGLLTVATDLDKTDTLFARLNEYLRGREAAARNSAHIVHRLDRETSGLVLFAKSQEMKRLIQEAWPTVEKTYWAIVEGRPNSEQGAVRSYLFESQTLKVHTSHRPQADARLATTHYRVLKSAGHLTLLKARLATGRKHQIRVQLAELGCPVVGDRRYGAKSDRFHRLALHACELAMSHPLTGERLTFNSPLPARLAKLFD